MRTRPPPSSYQSEFAAQLMAWRLVRVIMQVNSKALRRAYELGFKEHVTA
jgi:hypothetical protein